MIDFLFRYIKSTHIPELIAHKIQTAGLFIEGIPFGNKEEIALDTNCIFSINLSFEHIYTEY